MSAAIGPSPADAEDHLGSAGHVPSEPANNTNGPDPDPAPAAETASPGHESARDTTPAVTRSSTLEAFEAVRDKWARFADWAVEFLDADLEEQGIDIAWIEGRAKSSSSYGAKLVFGEGYSADPLRDFAGIRVIAYIEADKKAIVSRLKALLGEHNLELSPLPERVHHLEAWEFAYRTFQFHARVERHLLPHNLDFADTWFEIQVRSVAEHAWAAIDHKLRYKATAPLTPQSLRRLFRTAALLEHVDDDFNALNETVITDLGADGLDVQRGNYEAAATPQAIRVFIKTDNDLTRALLRAADAGWVFVDPDLYAPTPDDLNSGTTEASRAAQDLTRLAASLGLGTISAVKTAALAALDAPGSHQQVQEVFASRNLVVSSCVADYLALHLIATHNVEADPAYEEWHDALTELQEILSAAPPPINPGDATPTTPSAQPTLEEDATT